jgi:hypothetical protein
MKKVFSALFLILLFSTCGKKDTIDEKAESIAVEKVIRLWEYSIKNQKFNIYAQTELYPLAIDTFTEEYKDYYYKSLLVLQEEESESIQLDSIDHYRKQLTIAADIIDRKTEKTRGMIQGEIELVRPISDGTVWKIHNTTLIRKE